jgi:exopolysaccharide production protein ExoY
VVASVAALIVMAPLLLAIGLAVRLESPGGAIFRQVRVGRGRRRFQILKFRTMRPDAEEVLRSDPALYDLYVHNNFKIPEALDPRVTRIGRVLRRTSLDELPQLWNVLRGDMSLVGPRPIVPREIDHYGHVAPVFLRARPGLTGEWVASGHESIGYPARAEVELDYVRQWSLRRDWEILGRTASAVLRRVRRIGEGSRAEDRAVAPPPKPPCTTDLDGAGGIAALEGGR